MRDWRDSIAQRLAGLGVRPEREAEIIDELSQHLDDQVRDLVEGGATVEAARAAALAELDAPGELVRRLRGIETRAPLSLPPPGAPARGHWFQARWQDVRYSIRSLRRSPTFALTVLASFALTIGPITAILSIGNWLLWRPIPGVVQPDRLVRLDSAIRNSKGEAIMVAISGENLADLNGATNSFTGIAALQERQANIAGEDVPPANAGVGYVTANVFDVLGVPLEAGRGFRADDDRGPEGAHVAIVSHRLATRAFGGSQQAVDRQILINGLPMTVVGVLPDVFQGLTPISRIDVWYPGATYAYVNHSESLRLNDRSEGLFATFIARLGDGVSVESAQAELDVLVPAMAEAFPVDNKKFKDVRAKIERGVGLEPNLVKRYSTMMRTLLWVGGLLLLLGCTNVSNMLMVRSVRHQRDRAVRLALGASRGSLVLLQLTEGLLLAIAGGALGLLLAIWLKDFLAAFIFPGVPPELGFLVPMDYRVLAMTLGATVLCGLLAGLIPALSGRHASIARTIASTGRSIAARPWLRAGFAGIQFSASLALIVGALLFIRTLQNVSAVDLGFDPSSVTRHVVSPAAHGYRGDRLTPYFRSLQTALERRLPPGSVSMSSRTPYSLSFMMRLPDPSGEGKPPMRVFVNSVTPAYFDVIGTRIIHGRTLTEEEAWTTAASTSIPIVVGEGLARKAFGSPDAAGRTLQTTATSGSPARELRIVGVAEDVRRQTVIVEPAPPLVMYQPLPLEVNSAVVLVRSASPRADVTRVVAAAAREVDPSLPISFSQPLVVEIDRRLSDQRMFAWVLSLLGWIAFVLAAVGLYGLLAQSVSERTREFGIRIAIGSDRAQIFRLVLRQAAWIGGIGTTGGLLLAVFGSRLIEAQLYGVTRLDPITYAVAAVALALVVLLATLWPARAATRIEPVEALRVE